MAMRRVVLTCAAAGALASGHNCSGQAGEACGLSDADPLLQHSVERRMMDVYVSTAETIEDIMYWAVLYKSMKPYYPRPPHWLLIRKDSELWNRAHAIRMAIAQNFWHATVDVFDPKNLNMQLETVEPGTFRQLGAFQYSPDQYRRVVQIDADSLVFGNIDHMTHRIPHMILAREQGDCRNLTQTLLNEQPATNLMSMVPDKAVVNLLTTATLRLYASNDSRKENVSHANLVSRAYSRVHPEREQGSFPATEVVSATCLMHHRDQVLRNKRVLDNMKVVHLGSDGRRLINDIITHGEKRLLNTLSGLKQNGKAALSHTLQSWFECFASQQVKGIIEAAKNGPLGEK